MTVGIACGADVPARLWGFDVSRAQIDLDAIHSGGPPKDGIPALTRPKVVRANGAAYLADDDPVLAVHLGGASRAYPIRILNWHELVNDVIGGVPVLVSYCPLCGSGVVFDRRVDEQARDFGVSGLLWESNVLMYDRTDNALWSQLAMRAVTGPHAGTSLRILPVFFGSWGAWRGRYPDTTVLDVETGYRRAYGRDPYDGYAASPDLIFPTSRADTRRPVKDWVVGVVVGDAAKAYPFAELARAARPVRDRVGDRTLVIDFDPTSRSVSVTDADGESHPAAVAFWFAWSVFHPGTALYEAR